MRPLRFARAACAAALVAGCGASVNPCRDGTVLVTLAFDAGTRDADAVDVVLKVSGRKSAPS